MSSRTRGREADTMVLAQLPPAPRRSSNDAEDHLEELQRTWAVLQQKEKELERNPDEPSAYQLTQELLETALDQVQTQEQVEMKHASAAYGAVQTAIQQERVLQKQWLQEVEPHDDANDDDDIADTILDPYNAERGWGEDVKQRRDMAVSEMAHGIQEAIQAKYQAAQQEEMRAREQEEEAWHNLEDLKTSEEQLKATLKELQEFTENS